MIFFRSKKKKGREIKDEDIPRELSPQEIKAMKKIGKSMSEYMNYIGRPWHIIWSNILAGISRGIGVTLGVALVVYLTIKILTFLISVRFPWLSDASSELMHVIKTTPGLERYTQAVEDAKHKAASNTPVVQKDEVQPSVSVPETALPVDPIENVKD